MATIAKKILTVTVYGKDGSVMFTLTSPDAETFVQQYENANGGKFVYTYAGDDYIVNDDCICTVKKVVTDDEPVDVPCEDLCYCAGESLSTSGSSSTSDSNASA